jgi:hypothetical protein
MTESTYRAPDAGVLAPIARGPGWFTWAYFFAVVAGVVPVFMHHAFWPVPILAMLAFLAVGYGPAREAGIVYEFADSFYYLGFTLSVGSLLASLEPFNFVNRPDPEQIFHYFGLGMLTTLVGVVGRTMLQSYHRLPAETLEAVNRQLEERGREYLDNLSALDARIRQTMETTTVAYERDLAPRLARIGDALAQAVTRIEETAAGSDRLRADVEDASAAVRALGSSYAGAADAMRAQQARLTESVDALTLAIEQIAATSSRAGRGAAAGLDEVRAKAADCRSAIDALAGSLGALRFDPAPVDAALGEMGRTIADATARQRDAMDAEAAVLHAHAQIVLGEAREMHRALDEIANATLRKLERIP